MSAPVRLIPRDQPLDEGRKLRFTFTLVAELTLDPNVLEESGLSLDDVEQWLGGPHRSSEQLYTMLGDMGCYAEVVEHTVGLDDRYEDADDGELRFESPWEKVERERGRTDGWPLTRAWLDHVPSAGALPLGPGSNPPVQANPVAEEVAP